MNIYSKIDFNLFKHDTTPFGTKRYNVANSNEIEQVLLQRGFKLQGTSAARIRKVEKRGYQRHTMVFTSEEYRIDADNLFSIVITNSYDTTKSIRVNSGIFRLICANGLVVGKDISPEIKINHVGDKMWHELLVAINTQIAHADKVLHNARKLQGTSLDSFQKVKFLQDAVKLRTDMELEIVPVRRIEDEGQDLYTLFNVIQEGLVRGGIKVKNKEGKTRTLRALSSQDNVVDINKKLFDLAMSYAA